jgi:hypothetical protein
MVAEGEELQTNLLQVTQRGPASSSVLDEVFGTHKTLRSAGAEMPSRIDGDVKILYRVARVIIAGLFSGFLDFLLPNFTLVDLFGIV